MELKKFNILCKFCGNRDQNNFQTTMDDWDGYSDYTILADGFISFKCKNCGIFGTTDIDETGGNNKIDMFEITCKNCTSCDWDYTDS